MKRKTIIINSSITPQAVMLIGELEEAGFISEGFLVYQEEQESDIKKIYDKYGVVF